MHLNTIVTSRIRSWLSIRRQPRSSYSLLIYNNDDHVYDNGDYSLRIDNNDDYGLRIDYNDDKAYDNDDYSLRIYDNDDHVYDNDDYNLRIDNNDDYVHDYDGHCSLCHQYIQTASKIVWRRRSYVSRRYNTGWPNRIGNVRIKNAAPHHYSAIDIPS